MVSSPAPLWRSGFNARLFQNYSRPCLSGLPYGPRRCIADAAKRKFSSHLANSQNVPLPANTRPSIRAADHFPSRHIGPSEDDAAKMLQALGSPPKDMEDFIAQTIPSAIRLKESLKIGGLRKDSGQDITGEAESQTLNELVDMARRNKTYGSFIGCGYYPTITPAVIQRNVLESPAWYTSYTPYQAEISQGRLESLLNFQTLATDLTGLAIANASVLDEATAAAEAMTLSVNALPMARQKKTGKCYVVSSLCHPQTIAVLESRANGFGINIEVGDILADDCAIVKKQGENLIGVLAQYPDTQGGVFNFQRLADVVHEAEATFCVATDLMALTLLKPPGEFGADIAFGNSQRFGVPLGFGGPHAAFFACSEKYKRKIPGRLVGVSKDRLGNRAMRLALQTREQHIRREKATSNICTAQALLANMSAFYAIYHGPEGLKAIAQRLRSNTRLLQNSLMLSGYRIATKGVRDDGAVMFDTLVVENDEDKIRDVLRNAKDFHLNMRYISPTKIGVSMHEHITPDSFRQLLLAFDVSPDDCRSVLEEGGSFSENIRLSDNSLPDDIRRVSSFLTHPVFNSHHSETELLRYIHHLQSKDLSLVHSMIPLGSCTMKLNATTEMLPLSMPGFAHVHPFAPADQVEGYKQMIDSLSADLIAITGMNAVSLQPNSGAQGEFAGLRVIKKYQETKSDGSKRDICLIPVSAHGTNPASAAMAGMKVVSLKCDSKSGNLDLKDLEDKCAKHKNELAAIMVTYPSTFGVFEPDIKKVCEIVHDNGGQVYMDGANLTAQIGLCNPGDIGADVCHLNLHKTFCIPHGGGGPGVGPIAVREHLAKHLPSHPFVDPHATEHDEAERKENAISPVSAAPWGSASILPISYAYIKMMCAKGLTRGTQVALLNANYIMSRVEPHYPILYTNNNGRCAHEFILDARGFKKTCGVEAVDIAKRLQDYGFHAPTMSWPVANTLMIEPTESESKEELDRFCDALIEIRKEIKAIEDGHVPKEGNVLKMAPHPQQDLMQNDWDRPYTREQAAYPLPWLREKKFWPSVARVDDAYGDMNLFCTCSPVEGFEDLTGSEAPMPT